MVIGATVQPASLEEIAKRIIDSGAVEVRNVDAGQDPFVYSTGNRGPGYVMIKGLVGQRRLLKFLTRQLAVKLAPLYKQVFDFVEGNATGGMIPAWQLTDDLEDVLGLEEGEIPYCYLRGSRKGGGHGELITGNRRNPFIQEGMRPLIFEELVNFAGTTMNAAQEFRNAGYPVTHASCILSYDNPQANEHLRNPMRGDFQRDPSLAVTLVPLITLPQLLDCAESASLIESTSINSYREFLTDPVKWQLDRNLVLPGGIPAPYLESHIASDSAGEAIKRGHKMRRLKPQEAVQLGAPSEKVNEGIAYYVGEKAT